jgi:hypothetical protein
MSHLRATVSNDLSFATLTLCISTLLTSIHDLTKGSSKKNALRVSRAIIALAGLITLTSVASIIYWKIVSKIITNEVVSHYYVLVALGVFLVTIFSSYKVMDSFDDEGRTP